LRVLRLEGQVDEAILTVEDWLRKGNSRQFTDGLATEYGWMMREKGTPSRALPEINRLLLDKSGKFRPEALALLIERARLHAAMNDWDAAKNDLEEFFRIPSKEQLYRNWSDACLILGLVRQQRGDQAGALEAWRKGKYKDDLNDLTGRTMNGIVLTNLLMLDSLCQDLDEKRTEALFRGLIRDRPGIETMLNFLDTKSLFRSTSTIINRMGHNPKGKEAFQKMVLQTCSFQEYVRLPLQVFAAEMVREEAIGDKVTAEQEELLWKLSEKAFVAFTAGKIDELKGMQFALLWKRGPSLLGGIEVVKGLDPELRGPAAYFMGLRLQHLGRPAEELFRIALDNAPANSTLQRLTRIELEKMRKVN
jgi:tetratricopeptide (TPR) repeat protein